jgi:hypothetical protein
VVQNHRDEVAAQGQLQSLVQELRVVADSCYDGLAYALELVVTQLYRCQETVVLPMQDDVVVMGVDDPQTDGQATVVEAIEQVLLLGLVRIPSQVCIGFLGH